MTRHRLSFELDTDADPSTLLDEITDVGARIAGEHGGEFDEDTATAQDLS